jgi:hypothetical protein
MAREVWESIRLQGERAFEQLRTIVREGNVRRIRVKQADKVVAEFPLTVGVVGALAAPVLAAVAALVALLSECTIEVERPAAPTPPKDETTATPKPRRVVKLTKSRRHPTP